MTANADTWTLAPAEPLAVELARALLRACREPGPESLEAAAVLLAGADSLDMVELDVMFEELTGKSLIDSEDTITLELIVERLQLIPADEVDAWACGQGLGAGAP
jgi:hypothetical protein